MSEILGGKTKELVEGILYLCPSSEIFFRAAKIISKERNWKAKPHPEIYEINKFSNPKFLVIVETQIHVIVFGDPINVDNKVRHIYIIEGFNARHTLTNMNNLIDTIKEMVTEDRFLPTEYMHRIIYMDRKQVYVCNKISKSKNFFSKSQWSLGTDIYGQHNPVIETTAYEIIKQAYDSVIQE